MLLPILTRYLTPDDYGVIASFAALISFIAIFVGLSGHGAVDANYFRLKRDKLGVYIANVLIVLLFTTFIALLVILYFHELIESKLVLTLEWQILAIFVAFGQFVTLINLSLWVIEQKPLPYGVYQFLQTLTISLISIILIIGFSYDWQGQLIALIIGTLVFSFLSLILLYKRGYFNLKMNKEYMKDFLNFGLPMVPHQLGGWLRSQGDKIIIISLLGTSATGLFSVGFQIALVMSIIASSFNKALYPILFKYLSQDLVDKEKKKIVFFSYTLFTGILLLSSVLILIVDFIYPYLLGIEFQDSLFLTKLIIFSFVFDGFYYVVVNYLFYFKKTAKLAKVTFSVSILHIILSFVMIKYFGVIGAGYALITSGVIQFLLVWRLSNQVYSMPWFSFWRKNEI